MRVQQAREVTGVYPTSDAADERRRGDQEIRAALDSGVLLHRKNELSEASSGDDSLVARESPPLVPAPPGHAPGFYPVTSAYRDLLSWPTFVFDALVAGEPVPSPWSRAIRPAHRLAIEMMGSVMERGGKMQAACAREISDRVEGPVVTKTEVSGTVSHVLVSPGRYPRPSFQPTLEAQVVAEAQVDADPDED